MSAPIDLPFSVPWGSCAGSTLYSAYCQYFKRGRTRPIVTAKWNHQSNPAPRSDNNWQLSSRRSIDLHGFADDHAYKKGFPGNSRESEVKTIKDLEQCVTRIKT